jgi:hypothetical protein
MMMIAALVLADGDAAAVVMHDDRPAGSPTKDAVKLVVLNTAASEPDWPNALD